MESQIELLPQVRKTARKIFNELRKSENRHPSFTAEEALLKAAKLHGFEHFGVGGWCTDSGKYGIIYLNTGDTYIPTVYFDSSAWMFRVGDQYNMRSHKRCLPSS